MELPAADNQNPDGPAAPESQREQSPEAAPADYETFVTQSVVRMAAADGSVDQRILLHSFGLASSYLVTDMTMNPESGLTSWTTGFSRLVDLLIVLHHRGTLELGTMSTACKACSESFSTASTWSEFSDAKDHIHTVVARIKGILDDNGRTYRGERVFVP